MSCICNRAIIKLVIIFVSSALSWSAVIVTVFVVSGNPTIVTVVPSELLLFFWIILLTNHFTFSITEPLLNGDIISMIREATKRIPHSARKSRIKPGFSKVRLYIAIIIIMIMHNSIV